MNYQEELEQLRLANSRLESTVQELKLEISYYKGEAKRLEWEKDVLHQDVKRMSTLFKTWIDEVNKEPAALADSPEKINMMVKYPCRSISELLQLNDEVLFITSCQPPYFIEYVNKRWSNECGWNPSEILGLTCSFLQGEMTDKGVTKSFMKDIRSVGYAHMRVYNYRKSGEIFEVDVTVYPVFDSICAVGQDAEIAVLTHFASVMTNSKEVTPSMCRQRHGTMSSDPSATSTNPSTELRSSDSNSEVQSSYDRSSHYDSQVSGTNGSTSKEEGDRLMASGGMMQRMFGVSHAPPLVDHEWGKTATVPMSVGESLDEKAKMEDKATRDEKANAVEIPLSSSSDPFSKTGTDSDPISTVTDSNPSPSDSNRGTDSNQISDSHQGSDSNPPNGSSETGYSDTSSGLGSDSAGQGTTTGEFVDRRNLEMRFIPKCGILSENFYQFGNSLRLSNLLRLMLSSQDAMALLDHQGRFIHVNVAWSKVTGYELSDVEGLTLSVMEGADTDKSMVQLYTTAMQERRAVEVNLMHYRRSGEKFVDQMTVVPIQGGYMQPNVSHYCALCREVVLASSSNNSSMTGDSPSSTGEEPESPPQFAMDTGSDQTSETGGTATGAATAIAVTSNAAAATSSPTTTTHISAKRSHDNSESSSSSSSSSSSMKMEGSAPSTKRSRKNP